MKSTLSQIEPYVTRDGSTIRELMHPNVQGNVAQSLAEAEVPVGVETMLHRHLESEELYFITQGIGQMTLADDVFEVVVGDTICIRPGTAHRIQNTGNETLKILCCCSPAYSHDDTVLLEDQA
ncbi:MAG TPA: cupin domain-containing protein [Chromatiaceae bacterium]|jgi:mannose-6-phosphate isomerase-like protein (cupin superfamily)|nr:cupin domain-containing protein [Chromatiaceae bacterium]HIN81728.1 cupin domain-containing protein [Chromatiales bacterium]HIA07843.1 cupin domain-containing protein [Chromatiaceae bacterium]HIB84465.1 cupin domain-containing protein [Chromatiaceae bacterium]HIO14888.1 cupin domain-containing protein [Chromatiales bacterium]